MSTTLLRGGSLWDPDTDEIRERVEILVEGGMIREVSDRPVTTQAAQVVELAGRRVLPGLIDAHVHVIANAKDFTELAHLSPYLVAARAKSVMKGMLMRGFTTVRDAGGAEGGLARAVCEGHFVGPRLYVAGLALAQPEGQGDFRASGESTLGCPTCRGMRSITRIVEGVAEVRQAVREERASGADQIKVMASGGLASGIPLDQCHFSEEELSAAVTEARAQGTYVMAHAYESAAVGLCVEAGVRSIEHGTFIEGETARLLTSRNAFLVPTLSVFASLEDQARRESVAKSRIDYFAELLHRSWEGLDAARSAGVRIGHGSDLEGETQRFQTHEFKLKSEVMSPREVLLAATRTNAEMMGLEHEIGTVAPGMRADLLVVDGEPLRDPDVLANPESHLRVVMKDGKFYKCDL